MPALLKPSPSDTTLPGDTRRRVWHAPELKTHALAVLTATRLYLTPGSAPPKPEALAALDAGADPESVAGPLATVVELIAVRRAVMNLAANVVRLEVLSSGLTTAGVTIGFATPEAADAFFGKLWRRLGDGYDLTPYRPDPWVAARGPVSAMVGVLAATAVLALVVSIFDDFAAARAVGPVNPTGLGPQVHLPKTALEMLIGWMDWRAVCGLGGAVLAVLQVWLYRRVTRPPSRLELVRR